MKPLSDDVIKEAIRIQCSAKHKPRRVTIPPGWRPKDAYERNLTLLMARHDPRYAKMDDIKVMKVLEWAG